MQTRMFYRSFSVAALLGIILFAFWFCRFGITESDYFWHVASGNLMRQTGDIIRIDPFSWTREGMPYTSNHEWLSQIIFSIVAGLGAHLPTGQAGAEFFLRSMLVAVAGVSLLLIGGRVLWIGFPLAVIVMDASIGGFVDRPQLFSFALFASSLLTAAVFLSTHERMRAASGIKNDVWILAIFPIIHILWINMHGAAAALNGVVVFALFMQTLVDGWHKGWTPLARRSAILVALTLLSLLPASLVSPMGWENVTYLFRLHSDATVRAIEEWRPREIAIYIKALWPIYLMTIAAVAVGRRHLAFSLIILLPLIYLSRQAYRHEMLLSAAALAVTMHQMTAPHIRAWMEERKSRQYALVTIVVLLTIPLLMQANRVRLGFIQHNQAYGIARDRVGGAVAFLEREKIGMDRIFNTYNLGGELDLALQPQVGTPADGGKTFVDGRNIDFGDAFLTPLFAAATSADAWAALEQKYGFTVAIIDVPQNPDAYPYIMHLRDNPSWALVFMDDYAAVYLKNIPDYADVIARGAYHFIDPQGFRRTPNPDTNTVNGIEGELKRIITTSPNAVQAPILLARLYAANNFASKAETMLRDVVARHPMDYWPQEELALALVKERKFEEADKEFQRLIHLLGTAMGPDVNVKIAGAFEKEGAVEWAERYR